MPIDRTDVGNWKTVVAETRNSIESARLIAGKRAVNSLVDVAGDIRFVNLDGSPAGHIATPGLGSVSGPSGRFSRPEVFYTFMSPLYPVPVFQYDLATGKSTPFEAAPLTFDPSLYATERVFARRRTARGCRCSSPSTGDRQGRRQSDDAVRLRGFDISEVPRFRPR